MSVPRTLVLSVSVAAVALAGAQLGASRAVAAPAATSGAIAVTVPAVTTIGTADTITATVPGTGTALSGTLYLNVNALAALPAADLTVTETVAGVTESVPLSNDPDDANDAAGSFLVTLPASGLMTTFSIKPTSATGVRGQLAIYVEFDAVDADGNPVYEADNEAALAAGKDITQVPRSTPEKVAEHVGLFRPSTKSIIYAKSDVAGGGGTVQVVAGRAGDTLLTGDVFGSGDSYVVDYRPSTATFYSADDFGGAGGALQATDFVTGTRFGRPGDIPLLGAFPNTDAADGSVDTVAVYRPSNETFYIDGSTGPGLRFGIKGDIPLVGNWTGTTGKTGDAGGDSIGVFRPSNHTFYLLTLAGTTITKVLGRTGDKPVVGDWSGNGTSAVGVERGNLFYLAQANTGSAPTYPAFAFGTSTDRPVAAYVNTTTDLEAIAAAAAYDDSAVVAKTTAARLAVHLPTTYPRQVRALVVR